MGDKQLSPQHSARSPVLIVAPTPPPYGGMALQAQLLHNCLLQEGVEVKLIATNPPLARAIARVRGFRTLVQSFLFLSRLYRECPQVGVVHILAASYLYFFLRVIPAVILGRLFGCRVIINYRGGRAPRFFSTWRWLIWLVLRMAHSLTVPSRFLERLFAEHGFSVRIIPNLVDLDRFRDKRATSLSPQHSALRTQSGPRLLVTRNLEPVYNVQMALQAFKVIKQIYPDSRLDVLGNGWQETELKNWVKEHGLKGVFFHGAVANDKIPSYLAQADILLNPSQVDNMPISLLEAFATGVPVVSTRVGGIPDLVGEEEAALLVEPGNYLEMAEKIEDLLKHPEKVEQLTTYARDLCREFSWDSIRERWLEVYFPDEVQRGHLKPVEEKTI